MIATTNATFIFSFEDNTLILKLFRIHRNTEFYRLTATHDNKDEIFTLKVNDTVKFKFKKPKTEQEALNSLLSQGFKLL